MKDREREGENKVEEEQVQKKYIKNKDKIIIGRGGKDN